MSTERMCLVRGLYCFVFGAAILTPSCASRQFQSPSRDGRIAATAVTPRNTATSTAVEVNDIIFGSELEFTGRYGTRPVEIIGADEVREIKKDEFIAAVRKKCNKDKAVICSFGEQVTIVDSLDPTRTISFKPYNDPGVIEVPLSPMNTQQAKQRADLVQKFIFETMTELGLFPGNSEYNRWSAHLNFSYPQLQAGKDNGLFFRYFVDMADQPELASGVFAGDIRNAPLIGMYGDPVREALAALVSEFNQKLNTGEAASSIDFSSRILNTVYNLERSPTFDRGPKFNAINLMHLVEPGNGGLDVGSSSRVEQRSSYMPKNAEHMAFQFEIVARRLVYLQGKSAQRIEYKKSKVPSDNKRNFSPVGPQNGYTNRDLANAYVRFMKEIEMDIHENVKFLIIPEVREEVEALHVRR